MSNVEKIHVGARTGTTLSTLTRGIDGTTAASHTAGETVRVIFPALEAHQSSEHAGNTSIDDHTQYHNATRHQAVSHTQAMLGADSVGAAQIQANAVGASELADNAVDTNAIQALAVTAAKIANGTITSVQLGTNSVSQTQLADNAVDTAAIVDNAVTFAKVDESTFPATTEAEVLTSEATTSATYTDLATPGPAVTMTPPASGKVKVTITAAKVTDGTTNQTASIAFAVSGGNTAAASDARSNNINQGNNVGGLADGSSSTFLLTGLAVSPTTFTAKYRSSGSATATFANRRILVEPVLV